MADHHAARRSRPVANRWVWFVLVIACLPAVVLSGFLMFWGLFEQKSTLLTPFLSLLQGLPDELRAGPRGFRTNFWTLAFSQFLGSQIYIGMFLVLLVGPELISQDLRFNAMPLYFARPVRRRDYFVGKLGVIAVYLSAVMIFPAILAYVLGIAFSLDPLVLRDTWRIFLGSLAFGASVVLSAGLLMLAISSLSRNSRYVGAMWIGLFLVSEGASSVLDQTIHRDWCPLISYTGNLIRVRDALLDSETARSGSRRFSGRSGPASPGGPARPFGRRRRGAGSSTDPAPPAPPAPPGASEASAAAGNDPGSPLVASWQSSAAVLAGLGIVSIWILATRVRSLDRLR